jgi:hypothetical protein
MIFRDSEIQHNRDIANLDNKDSIDLDEIALDEGIDKVYELPGRYVTV